MSGMAAALCCDSKGLSTWAGAVISSRYRTCACALGATAPAFLFLCSVTSSFSEVQSCREFIYQLSPFYCFSFVILMECIIKQHYGVSEMTNGDEFFVPGEHARVKAAVTSGVFPR